MAVLIKRDACSLEKIMPVNTTAAWRGTEQRARVAETVNWEPAGPTQGEILQAGAWVTEQLHNPNVHSGPKGRVSERDSKITNTEANPEQLEVKRGAFLHSIGSER